MSNKSLTNRCKKYIIGLYEIVNGGDYLADETTEIVFEEIYQEYFYRVYSFIFKMTRNADLCEELTQETFYQAFITFRNFEGKCEIFTWLASIAKHTYYKYLHKNRLTLDALDITELENYCFNESDISRDTADTYQNQQTKQRISEFVSTLPEKYRDVVIMRLYAGMSFPQIAVSQKITENSAKVIFFRAKQILSEELQNELTV